MRKRLAMTMTLLTLALVATSTTQARTTSSTWHSRTVTSLRHRIGWNRTMTWRYQDRAGVARTRTVHAELRTQSVPFLTWIRNLWEHRRIRAARLGSHGSSSSASVPSIICSVFGPQCSEAKAVAWCESRYSTTAINGQYYGLFQMGSAERATYATIGYTTAYQQTVAAHNYFMAAGWGPWACA